MGTACGDILSIECTKKARVVAPAPFQSSLRGVHGPQATPAQDEKRGRIHPAQMDPLVFLVTALVVTPWRTLASSHNLWRPDPFELATILAYVNEGLRT